MSRGQILGRAGASLRATQSWAASDAVQRVGRVAEERTGALLNALAESGPTVLHDLRIPIPGFSANIDHVVVYGNRVLVIDTKAWAKGAYWTLFGTTRRGFTKAPHCDKRTIPTAVTALERFLSGRGIEAVMQRPLLAVWPTGDASFMLYRPQGAPRLIQGDRLAWWLRRNVRMRPADPQIVRALAELVNG